MSIRVNVDVTNPGQFFACCGLFELADRLWPGAEGWFDGAQFRVECGGTLAEVLACAKGAKYILANENDVEEDESDEDDEAAAIVEPLILDSPIGISLNWWADKTLKTWAGSMKVGLIAAAMSHSIDPLTNDPFNQSQVVYNPPKPESQNTKRIMTLKKREPFYFDCRRAMNSHSIDVGFSANDLKLTTLANPAVEFLTLVGLQRSRPKPTGEPRVFDFWTWKWPLPIEILPLAVSGLLGDSDSKRYRFENGFRSGQRKHKAFRSAIPISQETDHG